MPYDSLMRDESMSPTSKDNGVRSDVSALMTKAHCSTFAKSAAGEIRRAFQSAAGKAEDDAKKTCSKKVRSRIVSRCMTILRLAGDRAARLVN